jgi:hypothetical protein
MDARGARLFICPLNHTLRFITVYNNDWFANPIRVLF